MALQLHSRGYQPPEFKRSMSGRRILAAVVSTVMIAGMTVLVPGYAQAAQRQADMPATVVQKASSAVMPQHDGEDHDDDAEPFKILLFSKTAGFRHTDGINAGIAAITELGAANNFTVDATEDAGAFTATNLANYKTVVFLSTTSPNAAAMFSTAQQQALQSYIEAGGGYFGIHAASDANYDWAWYGQLVGGYFQQHPAIQPAKLLIEDKVHPSTAGLPDTIDITEEWYDFRANPRANVHVLASVDTRSYTGSTMANDHPIAWCQDFDGGRSAYTALGHDATNWSKDWFRQMVVGGIETTAGVEDADCGASLAKNYEVVSLDDNTADPMMLDVAADGRVFYIEQFGLVKVINPTTHQTNEVADLDVTTANESGVLGMALDPRFADNGYMYVYYSPAGENVDRLSRFTVDPTTNRFVTGSERKVLDVPVQRLECCHHGGSMVFDKTTGNLYLATGDNSNPFASDGYAPVDYRNGRDFWDSSRSAGNTNSLSGKVLRIHPEADGTYTVPSGNLFAAGTAKTRPEIFGMGFRNPFRINIDQASGHLLVADYGPDAGSANPNRGPANTVEWNIVDTPGNYGWPFCTGNNQAYNRWNFDTSTGGTKYECATGPINDSPHNTGLTQLPPAIPADIYYHYDAGTDWPEIGGGGAPMAGAVYQYDPSVKAPGAWPAYWSGKPLLGEWNKNNLFSILTDSATSKVLKVTGTSLHKLPAPATRTIKLMDSKFGPDGSLYVIDWGSGWSENTDSGIYRIDYLAGNRAPIAKATADVTDGGSPLAVSFSSAGSNDPEGADLTYRWEFGDGETSTDPNPSHTFATGVYDVQLTVTDDAGRTGVSNVEIVSGNHRPVVKISSPLDGQFFEFGDQISYRATVTDAEDGSTEDGTISCDLVKEQSSLGHFSGGSSHAHPMNQATGCTATVQTLESGGHGGDVWLYWVIDVSYTDKGNGTVKPLTGSSTVILQTKHRQAEHFNNTGRITGSSSTGDPGVTVETTSDPEGGTQNIGFIEPGDWFSFDRVNLKDISAVSMRVAGTVGADFELRWNDPDTGPVLGTVPGKSTSGWQDFQNTQTDLSGVTDETGTLYFVAKSAGQTGSVANVNWVDFIGKGATVNQRPDIATATLTPLTGTAPLTVDLAATAADPEGGGVTYEWNMGTTAGEKVGGATGSFTYVTAGTYTVTLTVTDEQGSFNTRTFQVKVTQSAPSCLGGKSDEFGGTTLDAERWTAVRPDGKLTVADGSLHIPTAPADLYQTTNTAPNVVLQDMPAGAWEVTTKVTGAMYTAYQQAGLIVYGDDDNYAKLVFSGRSSSGDKAARVIQYSHEQAASVQEANSPNLGVDFPDAVWLRISSDGTNLTPSYSADNITWISAGDSWAGWAAARKSTAGFTKVGLLSLANTGTAVDAAFDFFHLTPDSTSGTGSPSDEFDGSTLSGCRWTVVRPDGKLAVTGGNLQLPAAATDLYQTTNTAGNVVLQSMPSGSWIATTKVTGAVYSAYAQGGLIVYGDDDNYAKLVFEGRSSSGDKAARIIQFSHEQAASAQEANSPNLGTDFPDTVWLRLSSDGTNLTPSYSLDGQIWVGADSWSGFSTMRKSTSGFTSPRIGVVAMGTSGTAQPVDVDFDFFHLDADGQPVPDTTAPVTSATVSGANPAMVTLVATDEAGGSGVAKTEYRLGTQTWSTYAAPVSVNRTDVDQPLEFRSTDNAGNVEDTKSVTISKAVDTIAPVTLAAIAPTVPTGDNGWWTAPVTLTLTATDTGGGEVAKTEYAVGDQAWQIYAGPVNISTDGVQLIRFRSTDSVGNAEPEKMLEVKIDATVPEVAANVDGADPVTVAVIAADATSGVATRSYRIGSGAWNEYTGPFSVTRTGAAQVIEFKAVDRAGNTSPTRSVTIAAAPTVTRPSVTTLSITPATTAPYGRRVAATVTVTSAGGVGQELVSLYDGNVLIGAGILKSGKTTITLEDLAVGVHSLTARFAGSASVSESVSPAKTLTVVKAKSQVTLKASAISQQYGTSKPVTLTATVALDSGLAPAGQVRFRDGSAILSTVPVVSGKATLKLSQTAKVGKHVITAQFLPTSSTTATGSTSTATTVTVVKALSTIKIKTDRTSQRLGKTVVVTATVTLATGQQPVGSVNFTVNGKSVKKTAVAKNVAKISWSSTAVGPQKIAATFTPTATATVVGSTAGVQVVTYTK